MNIAEIYRLFLSCGQKISTDTRKIAKDAIFFALKGNNFDGNTYAKSAIENGARYAVVDDILLKDEAQMIYVEDVLTSLQELALHHRRTLNIPILAITGSNGKTTTKELIKEVLSQKYKVAYTKGNLNNHIGVPLTLLEIKAYDDIAVIEMGANHQGEIASYCKYTEPNFGIITNIGKAHLEGFGGIEGVIKGKTELYRYLIDSQGLIFVNSDDPILIEKSEENKRIRYSLHSRNEQYNGEITESQLHGFLRMKLNDQESQIEVQTQLTGDYNAYNILCAFSIGRHFEVDGSQIKLALESYIPSNSRSQIIQKDDHTIILDAYNANPSSMEVAIQNLAKAGTRTIAILGAMKELGHESQSEHRQIASLAIQSKIHRVILVGKEFEESKDLKDILYLETTEDAKKWYQSQIWDKEIVLIKGSRGMALEKILDQ